MSLQLSRVHYGWHYFVLLGVNVNNIFLSKNLFWLPSIAAVTLLGTSLSAVAQTVETVSNNQLSATSATVTSPQQLSVELETQGLGLSAVIPEDLPVSELTGKEKFPNATSSSIVTPVPGTVATSIAALAPQYNEPTTPQPTAQAPAAKVAQADIIPSTAMRGGKYYLGIGANIGLAGGDSSISDGNFAVVSKVGITDNISLRPSAILGDRTVVLVPLTYDFTLPPAADPFSEPLPIAPYLGVGAAIKTGDNSKVGFLVSGGVDMPLNAQFTATASVNAGFFDKTDIGLLFGVGYNFGGL